jgi:Zn-dependent M16 (insulinase) family peptidase
MIEKGIEMERVKEFVHQFEVNLLTPRENNGIRILEETMNLMNHRLDFTSYMNPRPHLEEAVSKLKQKDFVQTLLNKFFLNNKQMVVVRQLLAEKQQQEEPIISNVQMEDSKIKEQQEQLSERQN